MADPTYQPKTYRKQGGDEFVVASDGIITVELGGVINVSGSVAVQTGGTFDLNGIADALVLDADADTTISAPTDDQIDFEIAGADDFSMTANAFNVLAGSQITGAGSTVVPCIPVAAQQALSGAGAANITTYYTALTNTGADAITLIDGAATGQLKKIQMIVDPGTDSTLTPTTLTGGSTIVFADVGDYVILMWSGTSWVAIELGNDADGATKPVLA